jgi:hypothetical protein
MFPAMARRSAVVLHYLPARPKSVLRVKVITRHFRSNHATTGTNTVGDA